MSKDIKKIIEKSKKGLKSIGQKIKEILIKIREEIKTLLKKVKPFLSKVNQKIKKAWKVFKKKTKAFIEWLKDKFKKLTTKLKQVSKSVIKKIKQWSHKVGQALKKAFQAIKIKVISFFKKIKLLFKNMFKAIKVKTLAMIVAIKSIFVKKKTKKREKSKKVKKVSKRKERRAKKKQLKREIKFKKNERLEQVYQEKRNIEQYHKETYTGFKQNLKFALIILLTGFMLFLLVGVLSSQNVGKTEYRVEYENLPVEFDGTKIAQISDTVGLKSKKHMDEIIYVLRKEQPEHIFLLGDIVDRLDENKQSYEFIERMQQLAPVYYVNGDKEYTKEQNREIMDYLKKQNIIVLDNAYYYIKKGEAKILVAGIMDPRYSTYFNSSYEKQENASSISKSLTKLEKNAFTYGATQTNRLPIQQEQYRKNEFKILLTHRPEYYGLYGKYQLVLAGHTQGGLVKYPFINKAPLVESQGIKSDFVKGVYKYQESYLTDLEKATNRRSVENSNQNQEQQEIESYMIVTSGANADNNYRIYNQAEVVIINLHKKN